MVSKAASKDLRCQAVELDSDSLWPVGPSMVNAVLSLLICQWLGAQLSSLLGVPIPGPVIGLLLLLVYLHFSLGPTSQQSQLATWLLKHLSLFFVPAGVGVMMHLELIASAWLAIVATLVGSTALTLWLTAVLAARWLPEDPPEAREHD